MIGSFVSDMTANPISCAVAALAAGLAYLYFKDTQRKGPVPPGPKRYPIIGNLLNFPATRWAEKFSEWHQIYGIFDLSSDLVNRDFTILGPEIERSRAQVTSYMLTF